MRPITLEPYREDIQKLWQEQFELFTKEKYCDTKATFKLDLTPMFKDLPKARVAFTAQAFVKLTKLTQECTTEVAAHGVVARDGNVFVIQDILMYPQNVGGATVTATNDYGPWLAALDDYTFNHLRFQFHSHVNFSVEPSSVDTTFYKDMLVDIEDFYIFMIFNKDGKRFINIYDVENNLIYDNDDVVVSILLDDGTTVLEWINAGVEQYVTKLTYLQQNANRSSTAAAGTDQKKIEEKTKEVIQTSAAEARAANEDAKKNDTARRSRRRNNRGMNQYSGVRIHLEGTCVKTGVPTASDCAACTMQYGYYPCEYD